MNINKFFNQAKEKGITECELKFNKDSSLSVEIFHSEISSYSLSSSSSILARGIYNGLLGSATTEEDNKNTYSFLINEIIDSSKVVEKKEKPNIFKGSPKYKKKILFNKDIAAKPLQEKIDNLFLIEERLKQYDPRISEIEAVQYEETMSEFKMMNTHGLKLAEKDNLFFYYASIIVKEGEEVRNGYSLFFSTDPKEFDVDLFVKKVAENALSKLHSEQCDSKKYPVVFSPKTFANLVNFYISSASAEQVQKGSSMFINLLNKEVASSKITISEMPLAKNCFYSYFDSEGVATSNKKIIDKGVLKTYLYNLETAAKDNVESTGNATGSVKIGIGFNNLVVRPGKLSEEELLAKAKDGVYITSLEGLHSGINAQSGNFSLKCEGFMIENGKKTKPLSLITVAGNLKDLFKGVIGVANNSELQLSSTTSPSVLVKSLAISGK